MNVDRAFSMASTLFDSEGNRLADVAPLTGDKAHVLKNNIAFPNKLSQIGTCWEKISSQNIDHYVDCPAGENNSWNLNLDLTEDDFVSLDDPSMTVTGKDLSTIPGMLGPRNADGSLPDVDFLKLKKGSRAIDKGEDLGFPFVGKAPDLGAFEYGLSSNVAKSSSSAAPSSSGTTSIAIRLDNFANASGSAVVFDLQGRYLRTLQVERNALESALRAKFRIPGAYLVRLGRTLQRVNVN
jgi:hypothetical protein